MAIDAGIYQLAGRGVKSVADYDQEAAQVKQNKLAEMMSGMKMDEYKRGVEDQNQLRNVYAQFGADSAKNTNALYQAGLGKQAGDYAKSQGELAKTNAATQKDQLANAHSKISLGAQLLSTARDQASYDASRAEAAANGLDVSRMPAQFDPAFVAAKRQESQTIKEQLEQKWKEMEYTTPNANSRLQADTSIATNKLTNEQSDKNNLRTVSQQKYATDSAATNSRLSREQSANQFDRREQDAAVTRSQSKIPTGYRAKLDGSLEAIPGGPADLKINAASVAKTSDAKEVLGLLDQVDKILPKATGGLVGTGIDVALGAANIATKGADATAQLKAIEGALISKMPKMSGPQSDKDVLLYRQMAGEVGNSTLPTARRQAAANMVRTLNEKYAGVEEGSSKATTPASLSVMQVTNDADYAKVPKGAQYTTPDGQTRVKK